VNGHATTGAESQATGLPTRRAGWFVFLAWLLLVLTILAYVSIGIGAGIGLTYHPLHERAPHDRALLQLLPVACGVALIAAIASSLALFLRRRTVAPYVVVASWLALVAGGALYLASIGNGPQQYDRYVGEQHLSIPWQYDPRGAATPGTSGVSVRLRLCPDTLRGTYEPTCRDGKQFTVYPLDERRLQYVEVPRYQRNESQDRSTGVRDGHQGYIHITPAEGQRKEIKTRYYRLTNTDGSLQRTAACSGYGSCEHRAISGRYVLVYEAPETAFSQWKDMDQKLAALVDSWTVP